jgi:hypothetical protein
MNWFNNNFGYRANTATAPSNNFYTTSASNTTTPGSTTIGLGSGSIGLGPGGYGPGTIGPGTGTTGTGSNNGSTGGSPTWGNGTGWGNNGSIQFNPGAIGFGFWNGSTGSNPSIPSRPCPPWLTGTGLGSNNGNTSWGSNNGNTGWGNRSYDNFLINGFNPGHEQYGVVNTRWNRRFGEAAINSIDGRGGFWGGNSVGWGSNNGNTGWGNRSNESGRYYNYANQFQPYDNFLINGYNPGYEQYGVVNTRYKRRFGEAAINSIDGRGGFWGNFAYPRSLYGIG